MRSPGCRSSRADPCGALHLGAHRVRRAALEQPRESRAHPRTAPACRPARRSPSNRTRPAPATRRPLRRPELLRPLGRAGEDIREADEAKRAGQHLALPVGQDGQLEDADGVADALQLPVLQGEQTRERVRGLGARGRVGRAPLELLRPLRMVEAQAQQAGDRLRAEVRRRPQARVARGEPDLPGVGKQLERGDELRVELAHRPTTCDGIDRRTHRPSRARRARRTARHASTASSGRKDAASAPSRPAAVTVRICSDAHDAGSPERLRLPRTRLRPPASAADDEQRDDDERRASSFLYRIPDAALRRRTRSDPMPGVRPDRQALARRHVPWFRGPRDGSRLDPSRRARRRAGAVDHAVLPRRPARSGRSRTT